MRTRSAVIVALSLVIALALIVVGTRYQQRSVSATPLPDAPAAPAHLPTEQPAAPNLPPAPSTATAEGLPSAPAMPADSKLPAASTPQLNAPAAPGTVPAAPATTMPPTASAATPAGMPNLKLYSPIAGLQPKEIQDTFNDARTGGGAHTHEATDILAPRGTPVLAVSDGTIKKLFNSKTGGITIYQFDPTEQYSYYYAHLDRYADGLKEGQKVKAGDRIGFVGSTGDASPSTPHLHFGIFELGPEKNWWQGKPINPYMFLTRAVQP